jgi:hypothetical protein
MSANDEELTPWLNLTEEEKYDSDWIKEESRATELAEIN